MESSQLRRISIIGISVLCLSPVEFFSNKLFENKEDNANIVMATNIVKLEPNYLSNNYEIFNLNINTTSEDIEKLASENKKKEISDSENNLESETTDEQAITEENSVEVEEEKETKVVEQVEETKTNNVKKVEETNNTVKQQTPQVDTTTVNEKVETTTVSPTEEQPVKQAQQSVVATPNTEIAASLVNFAKQFVGYPYKSGGTDLYTGVDCSGFTMKIYEQFGYSLPHSSRSQASLGTYVSIDNLQMGDLIFYGYNGSISHVAIYIGNGQIVHATTNSGGIKIASYTMMPIITARRILN